MKKWMLFFWVMQVIGISDYVNAQAADSLKKWSIHDCFVYAAENNISVNTFRLLQEYALQELSAAKGFKIPGINASVGNTFSNANHDVLANGDYVNQLNSTGTYSANAAIVLWNGNLINNTIKQNKLLVESAGFSINESVNNITLLITQAYLNILLAKENLQYIIDLVSTSEALLKEGRLFYNAGSVAKINLLQLQSQYTSDKYLLVKTSNDVRQNVLLLKQLLQLPTDSLFDIEIPDFVEVTENLTSLHIVQETAMQHFPEIKIAKLAIDIASFDIAKAKAGYKPVLAANASIGSGYDDIITNTNYPKTAYFIQSGNNFYQRAGIILSIPIFSNRINKTNVEKANIGYRQSTLNLQNNQLILSQEVEQVYLNASNSLQAFTAANEQLVAATESFRIINEQFKLGGSNTFQLLQLRNQYVQAVQLYTQSKYTAVLQQKIYEFYLGKPITLH